MTIPANIVAHYFPRTDKVQISTLGEGNINDTFLAETTDKKIVLQRINSQVFPYPQRLIHNLQHLSNHLQSQEKPATQRWEDLLLVATLDGKASVEDGKDGLWRALSYIDKSMSVTAAETNLQATQTGWALGHFHKKLAGLDVKKLKIPLPGFHHLSSYLTLYDKLEKTHSDSRGIGFCKDIIQENRATALALEYAINSGKISQRIIHGDPKIANILFDQQTGKAVSIIDLDTVGPGLLQHDIGDCLRSICNKSGEESTPEETIFDLQLCEITLEGYFQEAGQLFSTTDRNFIFDGIQAITFELGLRFFTDYLQGNIYFKCKNPEETLQKALVQFSLFQDIRKKEHRIRNLISGLNKGAQ